MAALLLDPTAMPFAVALGILFGLLVLELVSALLGGSLFGVGGDADADLDIDMGGFDAYAADFDVDLSDLDFDLDELDIGLEEVEAIEVNTDIGGGVAAWLGFGKVPVLVWAASFLIGFGLSGLIIQWDAEALMGSALPLVIAAPAAFGLGATFTKGFSGIFARLIPKSESTAMSERSLGRRIGIVSRGTAARGRPAEVRVTDGIGNMHYVRAEPLRDEAVIPQGAKVLVVRRRTGASYQLVALDA